MSYLHYHCSHSFLRSTATLDLRRAAAIRAWPALGRERQEKAAGGQDGNARVHQMLSEIDHQPGDPGNIIRVMRNEPLLSRHQ